MTPDYWQLACKDLAGRDKILASIISQYPNATLRKKSTAFVTLLRAIVGQQISVKAAETVWKRTESALGKNITPQKVFSIKADLLGAAGLSARKVEYAKDLALHFIEGKLEPRSFKKLPDEELIKKLTAVKGIGVWSAEMFMIFNLQRPDVFPLQDIGLLRAVEKHYFSGERQAVKVVAEVGEIFRPWRSVATWYLWRSLDPVVVEY